MPKPNPTATPQEQIKNLDKSILEDNESAFVSGFAITTQPQRDLVQESFRFAQSVIKFHEGVTKRFDDKAWDRLQEPVKNKDGMEFKATLSAPTTVDFKAIDALPAPTSDDSYTYSGMGLPLEFRRTEGGWLAQVQPGDSAAQAKFIKQMRDLVDRHAAMLESEKADFEKFHADFANDMSKAFFGMSH